MKCNAQRAPDYSLSVAQRAVAPVAPVAPVAKFGAAEPGDVRVCLRACLWVRHLYSVFFCAVRSGDVCCGVRVLGGAGRIAAGPGHLLLTGPRAVPAWAPVIVTGAARAAFRAVAPI